MSAKAVWREHKGVWGGTLASLETETFVAIISNVLHVAPFLYALRSCVLAVRLAAR